MNRKTELTEQRQAVLDEIDAILDRSAESLTSEDQAAFDDLEKRAVELGEQIDREDRLEAIRNAPGTHVGRGIDTFAHIRQSDPHEVDPRAMDRGQRRDAAMRVMERNAHLAAFQRDGVEQLLDTCDYADGGVEITDGDAIAKRILVTETPAYRSGVAKWMVNRTEHLLDHERAALAQYRTAMSLDDPGGGYGVPALVDPTIILTSGAADAPVLSVARRVPITGPVWRGVTSEAVSWSFDSGADGDAGGVEVSDDSPTLAQPSITAHTARGFIPYSIEIGQDYPAFGAEMARLLSQGYVDLMAAQTITGSGTAPQGVWTAVFAHNQNTEVFVDTNGEINAADIRKIWAALPERFRARATWLMNVTVENQIRALGNGEQLADFSVDMTKEGVAMINGRRVLRSDYAPEFSNTTTAQTNHLVLGDFEHFVVPQRAGMVIEQVQHLFGDNNRPTGERGFFAFARVGHDVVVDNAFRGLANASI